MRTQQPPVRASVAVAALAMVAAAVALAALSLVGGDDAPTSPPIEVAERNREAVRAPALQRTASAPDVEPLPLPSRNGPAAPKPRKAKPVKAATTTAAEPQWNGRGMPSREWLRWQLGALVEQGNPHGGVSKGALDAAIDDALAAREAKLAMLAAKDPDALVAAQERFDEASRSLAANLGVEHVDLSAF